jgi:alpha-1,2-mannosyltransferase
VVALVVLAVWVLRNRGRARGAAFVSAAGLSAAVVCLPFFCAAPSRMLRMVVFDQMGRPNDGVSVWKRLAGIAGHYHAAGGAFPSHLVVIAVSASIALVLASVVVVARAPRLRVWVALLVLQTALLLTAPVYYAHYATFVAPALCLVVGSAVSLVVARVDVRWRHSLLVVTASCVALALLAVFGPVYREGRRLPASRIAEVVEGARCVRADSTAALVATNLLTRDLRRGCPLALDVTGVTYDLDTSQLPEGPPYSARRGDPAWQQFFSDYIRGADAFIVVQEGADGFGPQVQAVIDSQRVLLRARHLTVYRTTGRG